MFLCMKQMKNIYYCSIKYGNSWRQNYNALLWCCHLISQYKSKVRKWRKWNWASDLCECCVRNLFSQHYQFCKKKKKLSSVSISRVENYWKVITWRLQVVNIALSTGYRFDTAYLKKYITYIKIYEMLCYHSRYQI